MDPRATAGRIVHYYHSDEHAAIAAMINQDTEPDGYANITVFDPRGPMTMGGIEYSEEPKGGHWSWMPYQKEKAAQAGGNQSESAEE